MHKYGTIYVGVDDLLLSSETKERPWINKQETKHEEQRDVAMWEKTVTQS